MTKQSHVSQTTLVRTIARAQKDVPIGSRWSHYKTPEQAYTVEGLVIIEADDQVAVVYRAEYGERIAFVRPVKSFLETVTLAGVEVQRFTRV